KSVEYVKVNCWDMPEEYVPSGPLDLTRYPDGTGPALTVYHYQIAEMFHGPIYFFLDIHDEDFDASPFIQGVFSAVGRGGEGGPEPLFRSLEPEPGNPSKPHRPIPEVASRVS